MQHWSPIMKDGTGNILVFSTTIVGCFISASSGPKQMNTG